MAFFNGTIRLAGSTIEWKGKTTELMLRKRMNVRVLAAANYLQNITRKNVGHSGWGSATGGGIAKSKTVRKKGGKKLVDYRPSKPGQFPHLDTGDLRKSIFRGTITEDKHGIECVVGTILDYAIHHELGDRPFLRRTAIEEEQTLVKILQGLHTGRSGGPR